MNESKSAYRSGPLTVRLDGDFPGTIEVLVGDFRDVSATLSGVEEPGAWFHDNGQEITIRPPQVSGSFVSGFGRSNVVVNGRGGVIIQGGSYGNVTMRGGRVWIDGREVTEEMQRAQGPELALSIDLPSGSKLDYDLLNAGLRISGAGTIARLSGSMSNGSVYATAPVAEADVDAGNGSIELRNLRGDAGVSTSNGSITLDCYAPGVVQAVSGNGDIRVRDRAGLGRQLQIRARSGNGRVDVP